MPTVPLVAHRPDAILAWRGATPTTAGQFLGEVAALAARLPTGQHVLNLCRDRYRFAVALAASIVTARVSLLPPTHTPEMVRQMQRRAPDCFCIADHDAAVAMPVFRYPDLAAPAHEHIPQIDAAQVVAEVFTSGSTGTPLPHPKRWGSLVENVRAEAERLGVGAGHALVGTVPPQHMYGLESTVLMPMQSGAAFHAGHPFYPADIVAALADLPRPRALVTTPYHLRALLAADAPLPGVDLLVSATAPLSATTAADAETRFAVPLFEIYGCTETGQLASRRTAREAAWQTLGSVRLRRAGESVWAEGGHVELPTCLSDVVELEREDGRHFLLHGRHADLVNIAGKRTSLAYLNHQLHAIPGVRDGAFVLPPENADDNPEGVRRLSALVVAPGLTPAALLQALRARIDPLFLPRPLVFVDALPRNTTGKLPTAAAQALVAAQPGEVGA
jgi:acyl-coenzyme A synthetase/AMP-(fatty) acid ligase